MDSVEVQVTICGELRSKFSANCVLGTWEFSDRPRPTDFEQTGQRRYTESFIVGREGVFDPAEPTGFERTG
jgi:hypothetical protein